VRLIIIAALAVTCSAFGVVLVRYENRQVYLDVRQAEVQRDRLNEEWGKLQLESATWSLHSLVALEARRELEMLPPPPGDIVVVRLEASR
jgi:cell division protein FtsL|tara:strand:- start:988 stop:1257 length:270 start_codon:yes stop_codon:yes gene_type:complete